MPYSRHIVVSHQKLISQAFLSYCGTRFGLYFLVLHRPFIIKDVLLACVTCEEYTSKQFEDDEEATIIKDSTFWADVEILLKVVWPIMNLLRLGDTRDRPTLHLIYKSTLECKARLEEYMNDDDFEVNEYATVFFESLENYQDELCSDIAMAASPVDVKSWAQGTLRNEVDCTEKLFEYIESFAAQYECDSSFVAKAQAQALVFINKEGKFNLPTVKHDATTMSARAFFDKHDATNF